MTLDEVTQNHGKEIRSLFHLIRETVLAVYPDIDEEFLGGEKVRMSSYSINGKMICVISPAKDHCKLFLHHTNHVDTGSLRLEGKGKHARTVKIMTPDPLLLKEAEKAVSNIISYINTL